MKQLQIFSTFGFGFFFDLLAGFFCWFLGGFCCVVLFSPILSPSSHFCIFSSTYGRDAVVAVDRTISLENDNFQPHKRSRLYGITTAFAQCPGGNPDDSGVFTAV